MHTAVAITVDATARCQRLCMLNASHSAAVAAVIAITIWFQMGYYMIIFLAGMQDIPEELYEAARVDGASAWQQFRGITLPLLAPVASRHQLLTVEIRDPREDDLPDVGELTLVDAETGVAGKIGPDSIVDVIATYPDGQTKAAESRVVVPGARIIEVGQPRLKGGRGVQEQAADPEQVVPVTFALTPEQALLVSYAESKATEVRLALLRPGDEEELSGKERAYQREPDPVAQ